MKILLITETLLRHDNNVGNSYSNIFEGMDDVRIANICCQQGNSSNDIAERCFQISEKHILKNLLCGSTAAGKIETGQEQNAPQKKTYIKCGIMKIYNLARIFRFQIFFWIRNAIWKTGRWKSESLRQYIEDFAPDIIFAQLQDRLYLNDLIIYIKDLIKLPMVLYTWDDVYSLRQFSLSPLWWMDRFVQRRKIRQVVKRCEILYTISKEQAEEYERTFHKKCRILYKGYPFTGDFISEEAHSYPLKIIYTGNLYGGRWKTVAALCKAIKKINENQNQLQLYIYSATPLLKRQLRKLCIEGSTYFCGKIDAGDVKRVQQEADILLHAEAFGLKGSLTTRLSFSTKIVDYFKEKKCILALGAQRCASIQYLVRNDAAIVITDIRDIVSTISRLATHPEVIQTYAGKAWECGRSNHQIHNIQKELYRELQHIQQ